MRWIAVIVGFLMLSVPSFGAGSNILGLIQVFAGAIGGVSAGGVVSLFPALLEARVRRKRVDDVAATLFTVVGLVSMATAPLAKGIVASLLPDTAAWYGSEGDLGTLWFFFPRWLVYGFLVGFGVVIVYVGSSRSHSSNTGG